MVGYAFWTTDLEPLERGYDGPIQILVGINPRGVLAGIIVTAHREPYGDFSVDPPEFAAQFAGKDVRDPFKVGTDIEARIPGDDLDDERDARHQKQREAIRQADAHSSRHRQALMACIRLNKKWIRVRGRVKHNWPFGSDHRRESSTTGVGGLYRTLGAGLGGSGFQTPGLVVRGSGRWSRRPNPQLPAPGVRSFRPKTRTLADHR